MERFDRVARAEIDRAEARSRNLIRPKNAFSTKPLKSRGGMQVVLDPATIRNVSKWCWMRSAGRVSSRANRPRARRGAILGLACQFREGHGARPFEAVTVRIGPSGKSRSFRRGCHGPEHQDHAGADRRRSAWRRDGNIHVTAGDTAGIAWGSRVQQPQAVMAGSSRPLPRSNCAARCSPSPPSCWIGADRSRSTAPWFR